MQFRRDIGRKALDPIPDHDHGMKYAVVTFGCRVNQADSLVIEDSLRARGATAAPAEQADLVVVNTCSVTASADQGARQTIRRIVRGNPDVRVVVTGCYATRRPDEVARAAERRRTSFATPTRTSLVAAAAQIVRRRRRPVRPTLDARRRRPDGA